MQSQNTDNIAASSRVIENCDLFSSYFYLHLRFIFWSKAHCKYFFIIGFFYSKHSSLILLVSFFSFWHIVILTSVAAYNGNITYPFTDFTWFSFSWAGNNSLAKCPARPPLWHRLSGFPWLLSFSWTCRFGLRLSRNSSILFTVSCISVTCCWSASKLAVGKMHCGGKGHILSRGIVFADAEKRTLAAIVPIYDAGIPRYHKYSTWSLSTANINQSLQQRILWPQPATDNNRKLQLLLLVSVFNRNL